CYGKMRGKILQLVGIAFGTSLLIGIASLLLIIPGILLLVRWALVIPVAVLEDAGFSESTSRSSDLSEGKRWQILLIYVLYFLLTFILGAFGGVPAVIYAIAHGHGGPLPLWINVLTQILNFLVVALVMPVLTIALSLVYYDARVRKEALDLELLMASDGVLPMPKAASAGLGLV